MSEAPSIEVPPNDAILNELATKIKAKLVQTGTPKAEFISNNFSNQIKEAAMKLSPINHDKDTDNKILILRFLQARPELTAVKDELKKMIESDPLPSKAGGSKRRHKRKNTHKRSKRRSSYKRRTSKRV